MPEQGTDGRDPKHGFVSMRWLGDTTQTGRTNAFDQQLISRRRLRGRCCAAQPLANCTLTSGSTLAGRGSVLPFNLG